MIARLQRWALALVGAVAAAFGLWALVERSLRLQQARDRLDDQIRAARLAKEIENEVDGLSDDDLRRRLDRFVRPDG